MKKFAVMVVCCLSGWMTVVAQNLYPLHTTADSLLFRITIANRQLSLSWQSSPTLLHAKNGEFPVITAITLQEGDLVLTYEPGKTKNDLSYEINLGLRAPNGDSIAPKPYELTETPPTAGGKEIRQRVWLNFAEQLPDFGAVYTLYVQRSLMGAVNCESGRPAFTLQKQLPHYAAGAAGVVLIGLGQVYNKQKKDAYEQYQLAWAAGNPREEADDPFFQTAEDKRKAARICTYAGWALLGADALWYTFRWMKIRKRQKVYDKFCTQPALSSLQLRPAMLPQSPYPGIGISFTFSNGRP